MFMPRRGVFARGDWEPQPGEVALKILAGRDSWRRSLFAWAVPSKGVDDKRFAVDQLVTAVKWLGYSRVILESDNERALDRLLAEALKGLKVEGIVDQAGKEDSVPYGPQTNSNAETGVRLVKAQLRTLQLALEASVCHRVPVGHPLVAWLVEHATNVRALRVRDETGKTPFERILEGRGRPDLSIWVKPASGS